MFVPASAKPTVPAPALPAGATAADRALPDAGSGERAAPAGDAERADADRDDEPGPRRSPGTMLLAAALVVGAAGIGVVVLLGYLNSDRYVLACEPERAVPEQGRGFPPWGTRALTGAAWRPVKIAPETRCQPHETDDALALQRVFLAMVLDQATALLTARDVNRVDDAEALLQQALLLTRPAERESEPLARQRGEQHEAIERLLGDVAYWRGQAKVRDALSALGDAAKQFDTAAARQPRHVTDAAAWAARMRTLADELRAGSATPTGPAAPASPASASPASASPASASPASASPASASPVSSASASPASPASASPAPASPAPTSSAAVPASPASPVPMSPTSPPPGAGATTGSAGHSATPPAELERSPRPPPPAAPPPGAPSGVLI